MADRRRVVVAPDKFKGSLSAAEVARTLATVLEAAAPDVEVVQHPIADGGEGSVALAVASGFRPVTAVVTGPLGREVSATFAIRDGVAVVETASAAGLALLPSGPDRSTAVEATSYGVGELILAAVGAGATRVVVGAGGSATTDGGAGAVAALGIEVDGFQQAPGRPPTAGGRIPPALAGVDVLVACDVDNQLLGPDGAAHVYAPQKGADAETVRQLEKRLTRWADAVAGVGDDVRHLPGTGAAGGLAFGLVALTGARIVSGVELLLELTGFEEVVRHAHLVIVGEGSLDQQSLRGKGPVGAARSAAATGAAVVAVAGRNRLTEPEWRSAGLRSVYALTDIEPDERACMQDARRLLVERARQLADDWLPRTAVPAGATGVSERRPADGRPNPIA